MCESELLKLDGVSPIPSELLTNLSVNSPTWICILLELVVVSRQR